MRSFVRFCMVSIILVALAFFCQGLRDNFIAEPDNNETLDVLVIDRCNGDNFFAEPDNNETAVLTSTDSLTDQNQSEHYFIKFNTVCLTSPTAEGQTVTRTVTGASGSPCRGARRTELDFRILESKAFCHLNVQRHSLPTLRKLRL